MAFGVGPPQRRRSISEAQHRRMASTHWRKLRFANHHAPTPHSQVVFARKLAWCCASARLMRKEGGAERRGGGEKEREGCVSGVRRGVGRAREHVSKSEEHGRTKGREHSTGESTEHNRGESTAVDHHQLAVWEGLGRGAMRGGRRRGNAPRASPPVCSSSAGAPLGESSAPPPAQRTRVCACASNTTNESGSKRVSGQMAWCGWRGSGGATREL